MPTPNEQLVMARIEDQESRTDDVLALAALLIALLDASEPQVQVVIERYLTTLLRPEVRLESPVVQGTIAQMRQDITAARAAAFAEVRARLEEGIGELIDAEWTRLVQLYETTHGLNLERPTVTPETIIRTPFIGRDLETWLTDLMVSDASRIGDQVVIGLLQQQDRQRILEAALGEENLNGGNGATEVTRRHLQSIVDMGTFAAIGLAIKAFDEANPGIPRELYVAVLDTRTTAICRSLHGRVFPKGEGPYPPLHWNCRSIRIGLPEGDVPVVP